MLGSSAGPPLLARRLRRFLHKEGRRLPCIPRMQRGFLDRAARAKARARAKLEARRADPVSESPVPLDAAPQPAAAPSSPPRERSRSTPAAYRVAAWPERTVCKVMDGGWPVGFPFPPQPPLEPTWVEKVLSDFNLQMFNEWARSNPAAAKDMRHRLILLRHRFVNPAGLEVTDIPLPGGIPEWRCVEDGCARCLHGQGGYRFWWACALWTPRMCMGCPALEPGGSHPLEPHRRRACAARAAWPLGIAYIPGEDPFGVDA